MKGLPEQAATKKSRGHRKNRAMQLQQQAAQLQEQCQDAHTFSLPANLHEVASIYSGACANTHYAHDQNIEVSLTAAGMCKKRKKTAVGTETDTSSHNDQASKNDQSQLTSFNNQAQKNDPIALRVDSVPTAPLKLAEYNLCQHCDAKLFQYEPLTFCCRRGSVKIANNPMNDEIIRLLTMDSEDAIHFRKFIRLYNNVFAFSSLGGNHDGKAEKGIYVFQLQGQLYHYVPDLKPKDGEPPKYLQLYFYDAQNELQNRAAAVQELRHDIVAVLIDVVKENPYAQFFKSLQALVIEDSTQIVINHSAVPDQRTYNAPTSDEVAGIWVDTSSSTGAVGPHILVHGKSNCSHRIKHYYGCYDPLQYPLIFPLGECGWHPGLKKVTQNVRVLRMPAVEGTTEAAHPDIERAAISGQPSSEVADSADDESSELSAKKISCREYYAYKLQIRTVDCSYLLRMGRLFQQYIIDMYVKLENTRLDFFRNNQKTIRAELYRGVLDSIAEGETSGANIGRRIILPPSFVGGPRDMKRRFLNALTLVQRYGKPDLFITMTCNPKWAEIQQELAPSELPENRPDLIARVFRAKLVHLSKLIMNKKIFGKVAAKIQVVEFQKRGLPHAHILLILDQECKIKDPAQFDKYVSAELPRPQNQHLRSVVVQHMMHGPCGPDFHKCACMQVKNNVLRCKSSYPKPFLAVTTTTEASYPAYRRRDNGDKVRVRGMDMDNRWVIPYNPYLLAAFDCHLNVEICSTIKAVKYLYKYVYKGHDCISFKIAGNNDTEGEDEIHNFQSARWISPPEAAWRLYGFDLYSMHPPVQPLPVHTEKMQSIRFDDHENLEDVISDELRMKTKLVQFFASNSQSMGDTKYLYSEFPEHFVWHDKSKEWKPRTKGIAIGRIAYAAPSEGERYYLRILLAHVRGPTSFTDLLTVNGEICASFQEAVIKRGIIETDNIADLCFLENVNVQMPSTLRKLFAALLVFSEPPNPRKFWDTYYEHLSEDFQHQQPNSPLLVRKLTVRDIEQRLDSMGKSLADYNLADLLPLDAHDVQCTRDVADALNAPIPTEYADARKRLNEGQKFAYKQIMSHVKHNKPAAFFIDGPGGTGKTFLYCALYTRLRQLGKIVLPTASSGIAAANLPTGRTAHSRFKLPVDDDASGSCFVGKQSSLAQLLREATLLIWDEASMAHRHNIEALNTMLQDICGSTKLFGGKIVLFGGDFRQVLPILPRKTQYEAVEASVVSSHIWPHLKKIRLTQNMRAKDDPYFSEFLLCLGSGSLQQESTSFVKLPSSLACSVHLTDSSLTYLINQMLPSLHEETIDPNIFSQQAILTPHNQDADTINLHIIDKFPGHTVVYKSFDSMLDNESAVYPLEFLHTLSPSGVSPHKLVLKKNCPVILLRNLDPSSGLCNGTRLTCKAFSQNTIQCEIATGYHKGEVVVLPRISMSPSASSKFPVHFQRKQFPIKLSFAMTINKAQGQTLDQVALYLKQPRFSHGQLYVALSRARQAKQVKVFYHVDHFRPEHATSIQNIVAFEVLQRANILPHNI